jgi:hypothetical protein
VQAFRDERSMQLQPNVHRLVVFYRVPASDALDAATKTNTNSCTGAPTSGR